MGIRGEIFSTKVLLQNRTYFFNVKENRLGDLYLNIVESKNQAAGGFERQSIILFADDLQEFLVGFEKSLKVLEKSVKEKRKTDGSRNEGRPDRSRTEARGEDRTERPKGRGKSGAGIGRTRDDSSSDGKGRWKKREGAGAGQRKQSGDKKPGRVVVRKRKD
jgi:hypothetical protein